MKVIIAGHPHRVSVIVGTDERRATMTNPAVASYNRMVKRRRKFARMGRRMKHV